MRNSITELFIFHNHERGMRDISTLWYWNIMADTLQSMPMRFLPRTCIFNCIYWILLTEGVSHGMVIAWNRTGPTPLFKPMVTQFTDSHMVKNKSKNKKTLFKFGTMKNNKQQLLFPISVSHRPSHGYIPGAKYSNTEDLRSSRAHQQRLHGDTARCHYDNPQYRQWRQKLSNRWLIVFIETVNRSSMNKIKEVFLYVAISHENVMPWKHFRITGPL